MSAHLLVLGGTDEARRIASWAHDRPGLRVVSSLAGRVRSPRLPVGEVRVGGFGGPVGLADYLEDEGIDLVVDATHPFAARISVSAAIACTAEQVPLVRLRRPGWTEQPGDDWYHVPDLHAAARLVPQLGSRAFLTTGRQGLDAFSSLESTWCLVRCVDPPSEPLPPRCTVLQARGPYAAEDERALMLQHGIQVLVTKDSGGSLTAGKLVAARELGIPVVVVDRPPAPELPTVETVEEAAAWISTTALGVAQRGAALSR